LIKTDEKIVLKLEQPTRITHIHIDLNNEYHGLCLLNHSIYQDKNVDKIFEVSFVLQSDLSDNFYSLVNKEIKNKNYNIYFKKENDTQEIMLNTKDYTIKINGENICFRLAFINPEVLRILTELNSDRCFTILIMIKSIEINLKKHDQP
jgi:hypothetical protein